MRNGSSRCNVRDAELDVVVNGDAVQPRESRNQHGPTSAESGQVAQRTTGRSVVATRTFPSIV
jgi:hypothetical protein